MERVPIPAEEIPPISATWKRHLLVLYIDYRLFIILWNLFGRLIGKWPVQGFWLVGVAVFIALKGHPYTKDLTTPGRRLLGMKLEAGEWNVDPLLKSSETWLTLLAGILFLWFGSRDLAEWSIGGHQAPWFGRTASDVALLVITLLLAAIHLITALGAFRVSGWVPALGFAALFLELAGVLSAMEQWHEFWRSVINARRLADYRTLEAAAWGAIGGMIISILIRAGVLWGAMKRFLRSWALQSGATPLG